MWLKLFVLELEERTPFIRKIQPEEIWLYRNPMTESYVPGHLLWKFVTFVPLTAIIVGFGVSLCKYFFELLTALTQFPNETQGFFQLLTESIYVAVP